MVLLLLLLFLPACPIITFLWYFHGRFLWAFFPLKFSIFSQTLLLPLSILTSFSFFFSSLCNKSIPILTPPHSLTMASLVQPAGPVGFDSITRQIERRLLRRGFQFNVMVVGQSGLGKTTLINTLFASHLVDTSGRKDPQSEFARTPEIKVVSMSLRRMVSVLR